MKKAYMTIVVMCFIFGGYFMLSSAVRFQALAVATVPPADAIFSRNATGQNGFPENDSRMFFRAQGGFQPFGSGMFLLEMAAGAVFIIAGLSIFRLVREEDIKTIKGEVTDSLLLPEEKLVIAQLRKAGGEMTQKEISRSTGLSKVKAHRVLTRLEGKKILKRHPYGMTKKIVLEK